MHEYHLNVLQDGDVKQRLYVIQSGQPVSERTLRIVGLILDEGYSKDTIDPMEAVASMYVSVIEVSPS